MECMIRASRFKEDGPTLRHASEGWIDGSLALDVQYTVYGLGVHKGIPKALLDPSREGFPFWYSLADLEIIDPHLPTDWEVLSLEEDWSMIIGYHELVISADHFDGILERDIGELDRFREIHKLPPRL